MTTFSSLRFLFNFNSLQFFREARSCFSWFSISSFSRLSSAFLSSVLSSVRLCFLLPKNDFKHALGSRDSTYAVNLTYDRHTLIKQASRASEAFPLVRKTNNCPRIRVLTRYSCFHQAYMSSPGIHVLTWRACHQQAYVVSNRCACLSTTPLPLLGMHTKYHAPKISCTDHPVFKSIKSPDSNRGMYRCH